MNPEKLFDYLEGNLTAEERAQLESQLATDPQLQRELAIAREMHRRSRGSREVLGESEDIDIPPPSGKLGRRLIAVFVLLVLVNVLVGIAFIIGKKKSENPADLRARELAIRQQLTASLQKTAETALPAPTLAADEIHLSAPASEREALANNVVMLATQCGGSAAKAPPDEAGITVLADLPASREDEFRRALAPLAQADFSSPAPRKEKPADRAKNKYLRADYPSVAVSESVSDGGPMIAITFALPAESSDFVRLLTTPVVYAPEGVESIRGQIHGRAVAVFHTGVGEKRCRAHIENFLRQQQFKYLISAGFAGALDQELQVGDLLLSENFSSPELLGSAHLDFAGEGILVGKLATVPGIVDSKSERDRWAAESGAAAVDMETEFIAAACAARRIPMLSLRAISDTPSKPFPAPPNVLFDLEKQKTNLGRLALYLVTHPGALMRLNAFRQRVALARQSLTSALDKLLRVDLI